MTIGNHLVSMVGTGHKSAAYGALRITSVYGGRRASAIVRRGRGLSPVTAAGATAIGDPDVIFRGLHAGGWVRRLPKRIGLSVGEFVAA